MRWYGLPLQDVTLPRGDYKHAFEKIKFAQRLPTPTEVSTITSRKLLKRAQLRDRFDDVVAGNGYVRNFVNIA